MVTTTHDSRSHRFELITAGHHFLLGALPFRDPESRYALATFLAAVDQSDLHSADIDAVLLRCLWIVNDHVGRPVPSLVEQYTSLASATESCSSAFSQCVEDILRYRCIHDGAVQAAIDIVDTSFADSACTPQFITQSLNLRLSRLCVAFRREMGCTLREHIRALRLDHAAVLLSTTDRSIKEIWAAVGYNDASNFGHDFKRKFGGPPRQYRGRAFRPVAQHVYGRQPARRGGPDQRSDTKRTVLIVEDDEGSRTLVGKSLEMEGHSVVLAANGTEGLLQVTSTSPDLVLLDYWLGDMDGLEFLQVLRERSPGDIPAVAVFTADWDVLDHAEDLYRLNAVIASKLCSLEQVTDLVLYSISPDTPAPTTSIRPRSS